MGFLEGFLGAIGLGGGTSGGQVLGSNILNTFMSPINAGLDSLGLSQHGRDQYFARDLQRELLWDQINAQIAENQKNRDFSKEFFNMQWDKTLQHYPELLKMNSDEQFNLWRNQFLEQKQYNEEVNSPAGQVQRMMAAGLNPVQGTTSQVQSNMGGNSVGVPPMISGSPLAGSVSPIGLPQGLSGRGSELSQIGSFVRDIAQAKKTGKESDRFDEITDAMIDELYERARSNEAYAAYNGIKTVIERELGKDYRRSEIALNLRMALYYGAKEDTEKALQNLHKAETWLANTKNEGLLEQLPFLEQQIQAIIRYYETGSNRNLAESNLAYAKATTETDLRNMYREQGGLYYELKKLRREDRVEMFATRENRIQQIAEQAYQSGLISREMEEELQMLMVDKQYQEADKLLHYMELGLEGYRVGRYANAMDARNSIEERYNDWRMEHYGDTDETYEETFMNNRGHKVRQTFNRKRAPR